MHFPISVASGRRKHHQNSSRTHIHPSKFLIPEEEDDGRGGGGKTFVVLQFAKSYKLILKN
jgi:hypothetical protein